MTDICKHHHVHYHQQHYPCYVILPVITAIGMACCWLCFCYQWLIVAIGGFFFFHVDCSFFPLPYARLLALLTPLPMLLPLPSPSPPTATCFVLCCSVLKFYQGSTSTPDLVTSATITITALATTILVAKKWYWTGQLLQAKEQNHHKEG